MNRTSRPGEPLSAKERQVFEQVLDHVEPPVITMDEWIESTTGAYEQLVSWMSEYAVDRFGTQNNNWLRIIPALVDRLAKDITRACESRTNDAYHGAPGVPYQSTFFDELYADPDAKTIEQHDTGDQFLMSFNSGESQEQVLSRLKSLTSSEREWLDPWTAERENSRKTDEKTQDPDEKPGVF